MSKRERKHDFSSARSELRGLLSREVREKWPHARFLEAYRTMQQSALWMRLDGNSRAWLSGMVDGAHTAIQPLLEVRFQVDGQWVTRDMVTSGSWERVTKSEHFWHGTEVQR